MVKVDVTVNFKGRNYLTNVITHPETSHEEILQLAFEQVQKQWNEMTS